MIRPITLKLCILVNVDVTHTCIISPASESALSVVLGHIVEGHGKHCITLDGSVRLFIWATQKCEV